MIGKIVQAFPYMGPRFWKAYCKQRALQGHHPISNSIYYVYFQFISLIFIEVREIVEAICASTKKP